MSDNQFEGPFPVNIGQFSNLEDLDVSYNFLNGTISEVHLLKFHNLRSLDLSFSSLALKISSNWIPPFHLRNIGLAGCNIGPGFPTWLQSQLGNVTNLRQLDLSSNHLTYKDLTWLTNLTLLSKLFLSHNQFEGPFPDLKAFSLLTELYIAHNRLTGQLPVSIGQFSELTWLDVSHNSLNGTISEVHLVKLHNLTYLDLSFNSLALNFSPNWIPPFQLFYIRLAGCNMGHRFPTWLRSQSNLFYLDLSSAGISDKLPNWLWDSFNHLGYINLSHNKVSGSNLDLSYCHSYMIDLSFNNFSGPLPSFIPNLIFLSLSGNMFSGSIQSIFGVKYDNLEILDLSQNQFSGELPSCWENMTKLMFLNLNDNKFSGHLPPSLGSLTQLISLQFRNNSMTGELPSTLRNITLLGLIDGGGNELAGEIPLWMGTLDSLSILSLRQNNFSGSIPPEICRLRLMQILDLSENSISGNIPLCFNEFNLMIRGRHGDDFDIGKIMDYWDGNSYAYNAKVQWKGQQFPEYKSTLRLLRLIDLSSNILDGEIPKEIYGLSGLVSLNLSQNRLTGDVKSDIDQMEVLECLDLSRNKLSGKLPIGLAQLRFLDVLDLSSNSFSGEIPKSTQLQSFNGSSYAGNMELCGEPLPKCPENRHLALILKMMTRILMTREGTSFQQYLALLLGSGLLLVLYCTASHGEMHTLAT